MIAANDRYSGNDRNSGIKGTDHFFHYSGRCLYYVAPSSKCLHTCANLLNSVNQPKKFWKFGLPNLQGISVFFIASLK